MQPVAGVSLEISGNLVFGLHEGNASNGIASRLRDAEQFVHHLNGINDVFQNGYAQHAIESAIRFGDVVNRRIAMDIGPGFSRPFNVLIEQISINKVSDIARSTASVQDISVQ